MAPSMPRALHTSGCLLLAASTLVLLVVVLQATWSLPGPVYLMLACCEGMVTAVTLAACEATPQHIQMLAVCEASGNQGHT